MSAPPDDEFDEYLKQRLRDMFGLDDLTPEEQAWWDACDRVDEVKRRNEAAYLAWIGRKQREFADEINANPSVLEPYVPGISAVMAERGLRFVWEEA